MKHREDRVDSEIQAQNADTLSDSLRELIAEKVSDGDISKEDMEAIVESARAESEQPLSAQQRSLITQEINAQLEEALSGKHVPILLRILGAFIILAGLASTSTLVFAIINLTSFASLGVFDSGSVTTIVVESIRGVLAIASMIVSMVFGYRLLRNRRRNAAHTLLLLIVLAAGILLCTVIVYGIVDVALLQPSITIAVQIALLTYLDPNLLRERRLRIKLDKLDTEKRAEQGTLGRDLTGRGYIKLDFFNLFWIFMLGCVLGDLGETIYHMAVVDPGVFENRTGMLFGPFSPIYGFGGVLMTIALNRFHKSNFIIIFLVSAVIGGAFEFFVSWFLETSFGIVAWDYTGTFLSIGGRTNAYFMCIWGIAGTLWIKGLLPVVLKGINMIPWKLRYSVTTICAALMIVNGIMTLQSVDCWYERVSGNVPETGVELFYAENFDDEWMANHFQSMSITPNGGHSTD